MELPLFNTLASLRAWFESLTDADKARIGPEYDRLRAEFEEQSPLASRMSPRNRYPSLSKTIGSTDHDGG